MRSRSAVDGWGLAVGACIRNVFGCIRNVFGCIRVVFGCIRVVFGCIRNVFACIRNVFCVHARCISVHARCISVHARCILACIQRGLRCIRARMQRPFIARARPAYATQGALLLRPRAFAEPPPRYLRAPAHLPPSLSFHGGGSLERRRVTVLL